MKDLYHAVDEDHSVRNSLYMWTRGLVLPYSMSSYIHAPRSDDSRPPQMCSPSSFETDLPELPKNLLAEDNYQFEFQDVHTPDRSVNADADGIAKWYARFQEGEQSRGPFFGVRHSKLHLHNPQDPFDYENNFNEDQPHQEMGERARMWRTYLAESAKVDADKVANWTDALDVLLVFAGLFSGVVSTFVTQTFQTLQIDNSEVTSYLVFELVHLQRASMDGLNSSSVAHSPLTPNMTFRPTSTATWVNGLWFTSLALSLTTALIAVLTKQWIHEYRTSIQLGTYRERSRIRQFRFTNLSEWHVPVIIGLLPVVMHVALGFFCAGLILLLLSLSRRMTASISVVVAAALAAYLVTNILPVFDPACPYKTPLTHYAYIISRHLQNTVRSLSWPRLSRLIKKSGPCPDDLNFESRTATSTCESCHTTMSIPNQSAHPLCTSTMHCKFAPPSLADAEKAIVHQGSYTIDAQASVWLYGVSSNTSVQMIVLQAIGDLPLRSIPLITQAIPVDVLKQAVNTALYASEYQEIVAQPAYERLVRSIIRLSPEKDLAWPPQHMAAPDSLPRLLNFYEAENAARFLSHEILTPSTEHDIAVWVQILRNALGSGTEWLGMHDNSPVWQRFISWFFLESHTCLSCAQRLGSPGHVYSCTLRNYGEVSHISPDYGIDCTLSVLETSMHTASTTEVMNLEKAVQAFLIPSLSEFILGVFYPSSCKEPVYDGIPSDIRLRHALIQLHSIHLTGFPRDVTLVSPISRLITGMESSIGLDGRGGFHTHHPNIPSAIFHTVTSIIDEEPLLLAEKQRLLHPLFRAMLLDSELIKEYRVWMTESVAVILIRIIFDESRSLDLLTSSALLVDVLEAATRAKCSVLLPKLYTRLISVDWLKQTSTSCFGCNNRSFAHVDRTALYFLAAAFVRGLDVLRQVSAPVHARVWKDLETPSNLLLLCKLFILSDVERRKELWSLASYIGSELWEPCLGELNQFLESQVVQDGYQRHTEQSLRIRYAFMLKLPLDYQPYDKVFAAFREFARDVRGRPTRTKGMSSGHKMLSLLGTFFTRSSEDVVDVDEHEMA